MAESPISPLCFNHGRIVIDAENNNATSCACLPYYNPAINCSASYYEIWQGGYLPLPLMILIYSVILFTWMFAEIVVDIRNKSIRALRRPGTLAKSTLAAFCIPYLISGCFLLRDWYFRSPDYHDTAEVIGTIWTIPITCTYYISMLHWIELVRKAKDLDAAFTRDNKTRALRGIVWFVVAAYSVTNIVAAFLIGLKVASLLRAGAAVIILIFAVVIVCVFLIPNTHWARKLLKDNKSSRSLRQVIRRNSFMITSSCLSISIAVVVVLDFTMPDSPGRILAFQYLYTLVNITSATLNGFFIESYATRGGCCKGYKKGWDREASRLTRGTNESSPSVPTNSTIPTSKQQSVVDKSLNSKTQHNAHSTTSTKAQSSTTSKSASPSESPSTSASASSSPSASKSASPSKSTSKEATSASSSESASKSSSSASD